MYFNLFNKLIKIFISLIFSTIKFICNLFIVLLKYLNIFALDMIPQTQYDIFKRERLNVGLAALSMRANNNKISYAHLMRILEVSESYLTKAMTDARLYLKNTPIDNRVFNVGSSFVIDLPEPTICQTHFVEPNFVKNYNYDYNQTSN